MKRYSWTHSVLGRDWKSTATIPEARMLKQACQEVRRTGIISDELKGLLDRSFDKRARPALALVESRKVGKYTFEPSRRVVWVVTGREKEYQIVPESMFCTCDDYYFRVMGNKRQLCYHLIAQFIAEAAHQYLENVRQDSEYAEFAARWKPFERAQ